MVCAEFQKTLNFEDKSCFSSSTTAKENGKTFRFDNRSKKSICRVKVDDCLIKDKTVKKCDYLFKVSQPDTYYLVELKGVHVEDAVEQIVKTFDRVNSLIRALPTQYTGVIVSSSVPSGTEQKFRKLQDKYYRDKRLRITKTHNVHEELI